LSREILDNTVQLMTVAFGLVAALAWNVAIQALFEALLAGREISRPSFSTP
jgi:hypothetical protein